MASNTTKAAQHGDAGDLRKAHFGRGDTSEHSQDASFPQDRLVAVRAKNNRTRFETRLRSYDGLRRVVLCQREQIGAAGDYRDTGPTLVFAPDKIGDLIELLREAEQAAVEEGLIR